MVIAKTTTARRDRSRRNRANWLAASMVALALSATACGGGTEAASDGNAPIKIGVMVDKSGPTQSVERNVPPVLEAWADDVNASGGIIGRQVEIDVRDTRGDAPTAVSIAEEFIADESYAAVISASTGTDGAVGETLAESGLPVIGGHGYHPEVWGKLKNWFPVETTFPGSANGAIYAAKADNATKVGTVLCGDSPACLAAAPIFEKASRAIGLNYTGHLQVLQNAPNYTAECLELINRDVSHIMLAAQASISARVAQDCLKQGFDGRFVVQAGTVVPEIYNIPGIKLTGTVISFPWWGDSPAVQHFRSVMEAHNIEPATYGMTVASATWATGELLKKALTDTPVPAGQPVTRQDVLKAYGAIKNETLDGLVPNPLTFTADQPAPLNQCFWLYRAENGQFSGGEQPYCPPSA